MLENSMFRRPYQPAADLNGVEKKAFEEIERE